MEMCDAITQTHLGMIERADVAIPIDEIGNFLAAVIFGETGNVLAVSAIRQLKAHPEREPESSSSQGNFPWSPETMKANFDKFRTRREPSFGSELIKREVETIPVISLSLAVYSRRALRRFISRALFSA